MFHIPIEQCRHFLVHFLRPRPLRALYGTEWEAFKIFLEQIFFAVEHSGEQHRKVCPVCAKEAGFMAINRKMRPDIMSLFKPPGIIIQECLQRVNTVVSFQAYHRDRLLKYHQDRVWLLLLGLINTFLLFSSTRPWRTSRTWRRTWTRRSSLWRSCRRRSITFRRTWSTRRRASWIWLQSFYLQENYTNSHTF